jgi:hypothetical protein
MIKTLLLLSILLTAYSANAEKPKGGILDQKAPAITADKWVSLPAGAKAPTPKSLKGKVIYLYCFQSWCPGCHSSGFPTLQKVSTHFKDDKAVHLAPTLKQRLWRWLRNTSSPEFLWGTVGVRKRDRLLCRGSRHSAHRGRSSSARMAW